MVNIRNTDNSNREDDRRAELEREKAKTQAEKRSQHKSMETFEAKLAEHHAGELANKEIENQKDALHTRQGKKEKEEQSLIDKLINRSRPDDSKKNSKEQEIRRHLGNKETKEKESEFAEIKGQENQQQEAVTDKKELQDHLEISEDSGSSELEQTDQPESKSTKKGDVSEEGHKRVAERQDGRGDGGSGGGSKGQDAHGGNFGGGHDGSGSDQKSQDAKQKAESNLGQVPTAIRGFNASTGFGGFGQSARSFTQQDLDQIVSAVEVGVNSFGEDVFAVTLDDDFFDGLKLQATRTPQGVVLQFLCPNMQIKATFLKERPKIYEKLRAKNISVFRIDIV